MVYDYIVIILNYNSSDLLENAIESLRKNAKGTYKICIVDNNSPKIGEKEKLLGFKSNDVEVLLLDENAGYGAGNNKAVVYMNSKYETKYYVIMNPDIELQKKGTIEGIIENCEKNSAVGGQPLVWNYYYGSNPNMQINIGKAVGYSDLCIQSNLVLRMIFKRRFNDLVFINDMPYKKQIEYYVPSGAFFILRKDVYDEILGFDDDTFLYGEETIIGFKLKQRGYHLLFCPEYCVKHLQGATTGYDRYSWDKKRLQYLKESRDIYMKKYLKCSQIQVLILDLLLDADSILRRFYVIVNRRRIRKQNDKTSS